MSQVPARRPHAWLVRSAIIGGLIAGSCAAGALLAPWVALGNRRFSSLDLISSASALDVIEGQQKTMVLAAWMVTPTLVAASYVLAATHRRRLLGWVLVPIGPIFVVGFVAVKQTPVLQPLWGQWLGVIASVVCTLCGATLLLVSAATNRSAAN